MSETQEYKTAEYQGGERKYDLDKHKLGLSTDNKLLISQVDKLIELLESYGIKKGAVNYQIIKLINDDSIISINAKLMALVIYIDFRNISIDNYTNDTNIKKYLEDEQMNITELKINIIRYLDFIRNI